MFKIKPLCLIAVAAISTAALTHSEPAEAAKAKYDRTKPHVNVGTRASSAAEPGKPERPTRPGKRSDQGGSKRPDGSKRPGNIKSPGGGQPQVLSNLVFHMPYPAGPLPGAPKTGYCGKQTGGTVAGEVVLGLRNAGFNPVPQFSVSVTMRTSPNTIQTIYKQVGPLGPGAVATATFPLFLGAWDKGLAQFKMKLDTANDIEEGIGEANNELEYACVAPAG